MSADGIERRRLGFSTVEDVLADAEAQLAGPHRTTGQWSAREIVGHVADFLALANGNLVPDRLPLPLRLMGGVLRSTGVHRRALPRGIKAPAFVDAQLKVHRDGTDADALAYLRRETLQAADPARGLRHPSPLFGRLTREQWVALHCRHAELHFAHLHAAEDRPGRLDGR